MATIGGIYLGGDEGDNERNNVFYSGVGFLLSVQSKINKVFIFNSDKWEVEIKSGKHYVVARCKKALCIDEILSIGFEYCQRALDLIAVVNKGTSVIMEPGFHHIVLYSKNGQVVLKEVSCSQLKMGTDARIEVRDKEGNLLPSTPAKQIKWVSAFRYYRVSQSSSDLFEAYRNLFLSIESLLSSVCPKSKNESERKWLNRVFTNIGIQVEFDDILPNGDNDIAKYFIKYQYDNVRCKIFHAKNVNVIIPYDKINPTIISEAYETLLRIWHKIAMSFFGVVVGGGVVTFNGFKYMMDNLFNGEIELELTDDYTEPTVDDQVLSPSGHIVYSYSGTIYKGEYQPGIILIHGFLEGERLSRIKLIHRIGLKVDNELFSIAYKSDGLNPVGVTRFESDQYFRLINISVPKTLF